MLDSAGSKVAETTADNYGDFKFDGLKENSGKYTVQIAYKTYPQKHVPVELTKSVFVGVIKLS